MYYSIIRSWLTIGLISAALSMGWGQQEVINLKNPSFEGAPARGEFESFFKLEGWSDCGRVYFPIETPPDVQPSSDTNDLFFDVMQKPFHGNTYIGMVVRQHDSWESINQRLSDTLRKDKCYELTAHLCRASEYNSPTRNNAQTLSFTRAAVLRIWGGNGYCKKEELLAESPAIKNNEWQAYVFNLKPQKNYTYIIFEAFYKIPVLYPYNGHILLDKLSDIKQISCSEEEEIIARVEKKPEPHPKIRNNPTLKKDDRKLTETEYKPEKAEKVPEKKKLIEDLDRDKIEVGQTIRIDRLFFAADKAEITDESYPVLDEIATFLQKNEDVIIEIGGHTNTIPEHSYCDKLSTERAKSVYDYMIEQGIPKSRLRYKGYGKRKPLTYADSHAAQKRNQRVEIKILSVEG